MIYRPIIYLLWLVFVPFCTWAKKLPQPVSTGDLVCEYQTNPIAIDVQKPRLSWKLYAIARNTRQYAYEIRVAANPAWLAKGKQLLWGSGKVISDESTQVPYNGPALISREMCYWQVRVWDTDNHVSAWSDINHWKMGLLKRSDWTGRWIQDTYKSDTTGGPSAMIRKQFRVTPIVKSAYLYITSHGLFEAMINGHRTGNDYFTPGFTSYNNRLQYQVYDVSSLVHKGENTIGVTLGDGWYRGYTYNRKKNVYGKKLALLFQLEITYDNGTRQLITSGNDCRTAYGPIRSSSFYDGEVYDATREKPNWLLPGYDDKKWDAAQTNDSIKDNLIAMQSLPVKKHEKFVPLKIITTPEGDRVVDFGQNLVGWVQFRLKGNHGDTLRLYHSEVLDQKGNFYTKNLRSAKQQVAYIFKGGNAETFEPHFTYQGFRYVKVQGYSGPLDSSNFVAYALYSDLKQTGKFITSNPLINQLQHNIQWSQKGNFVDIPTDCPQRDERMGWTGDAQAFCSTAAFNMNIAPFFTKWLKDLSSDQLNDGAVPYVIPNVLDSTYVAAAGWGDAATIIPWNIYLAYGDKQILQQQYASMKSWVNYIRAHSRNNLWNIGYYFGDWLFYSGTDYEDGAALTDKGMIAQAFYIYSTQLLINAANILKKEDDVKAYTALLDEIKKAFQAEYVTPGGRMTSGTQTAYVLALNFDLLPESLRASAAKRLVQNIDGYDGHVTTGFLGTPYICRVLSRFGYTDEAYALLMKDTYPSWLYPVKMGATTIWERLDGIKADKSFEDAEMNSFNHYAYGAIGDWMYRDIAGINTDETSPGFHKIRITPHIGGGLTSAQGDLVTMYGEVKSGWTLNKTDLKLNVIIPANTTAILVLPWATGPVTEGGNDIYSVQQISGIQKTGNNTQLTIGSGTYSFDYVYKPIIPVVPIEHVK